MVGIRRRLRWKERSESFQTVVILLLVASCTLGGYGILCLAMGTPTPIAVVTSESMETALYKGDLLILQARAPEDIQIDDIIVFQDKTWSPTERIVHRVVDIQEINGTLYYYTKGDHNPSPDDQERTYDEIIGVVVVRIPFIGYVSLFLRDNLLIVLLMVIIVILVIPELIERRRHS